MKTLTLACNQCGASLMPPDDARFVTCAFCQVRLQIHHEGNTHFTRVMEAVRENTQQIAEDLNVIKLQNDLARVDREWSLEREKYLIRNKRGVTSEPDSGDGWVGFIFALVFICCFVFMLIQTPGPAGMVLAPLGIGVFLVISMLNQISKAQQFREAKARHETARLQLEQALTAAQAKAKD